MEKLTPKDFVAAYLPFAKESQESTGISAIFTLAQAALESGWGEHALGYNFFGIKAGSNTPTDERQLLVTREVLSTPSAVFPEVISITKLYSGKYEYRVKDWFRAYETPERSFTDHGNFFLENARYAQALEVKADPCAFAEAIAAAGYATDPHYATSLRAVIQTIEKKCVR